MNAPPPWTLHGHGFISLLPATPRQDPSASSFRGGVAAMMLVNYTSSPVGPYRELLFLGGFFESGGVVHPKVTRIVVDSEASARWGRRNWGLPKEVARFDWQGSDGQGGFVRVEQSGRLLGEFAWTEAGPSVPATTALIPARWGTLAQPCQERVLLTRPRGTGRVRFARLSHALVNPDLFPPLPTPLVSLRVTNFTMRFPPPTFRAGGRGDHTAV